VQQLPGFKQPEPKRSRTDVEKVQPLPQLLRLTAHGNTDYMNRMHAQLLLQTITIDIFFMFTFVFTVSASVFS
jgi:hypothetical protein